MPVKEALLGLLGVRTGHGYDLKLRYDTLLDPSRSLQQAQVYATLARLERDELIEVAEVDQGGGPPRRTYALTPDGRRALGRWLDEPVGVGQVHPPALRRRRGPTGQRAGALPRRRRDPAVTRPLQRVAADPVRVRVPIRPARPRARCGRERRAASAAQRLRPPGGEDDRAHMVGPTFDR